MFLVQVVCRPSAPPSRTVCVVRVAHRPSKGRVRTVHISRCGTRCSGRFYGPSAVVSRIVRLVLADRPPGHRGLSATGTTDCLSPLLLELCFRVALNWGLFLGLVGSL
jgi:hypothetical protein